MPNMELQWSDSKVRHIAIPNQCTFTREQKEEREKGGQMLVHANFYQHSH